MFFFGIDSRRGCGGGGGGGVGKQPLPNFDTSPIKKWSQIASFLQQ